MKVSRYLIGLVMLCAMAACHTQDPYLHQKQQAEQQIEMLSRYVNSENLDSLNQFVKQQQDICFYLFDSHGLVYWTANRLVIGHPSITSYNKWEPLELPNASCLARWTRVGRFNLMAVIPLEWKLVDAETLRESFSYQPLIRQVENTPIWKQTRTRARAYYFTIWALFVIILIIGIIQLVHSHGFKAMKLRAKMQYLIVTLIVACFVYIFLTSVHYVRNRYAESQEKDLQSQCMYIQSALQQLYYWDYSLTERNTGALNIDLRDLAYTFGTDIHVYDMEGSLVGSSTPVLFEKGLISRYLSPEVFFSTEPTRTRHEHLGKRQYLCAYTTFVNGSNVPIGYLAVPSFLSEAEMAMEVDSLLARLLPPYLVFLLLTVLVSLLLSRQIVLPISRLSEKLRHFELGSHDNRLQYPYQDELGELVTHYNELVTELEIKSRQLAVSAREGAWRTMARQIAHEINNPLTPMKLSIQQLMRLKGTDRFDEAFDKASNMLVAEIDNLSHIATSFSTFAKMPETCVTEVDVAERLSTAVLLFRNEQGEVPIRYIGPDTGVTVLADKEQIQQVFINILKNAVQALTDSPVVDKNIIVILKDFDASEVEISISDNGPGIAEEARKKIFVPNFTTKSTGTGLGLAISKNIVEACGGHITFETSEKGTTFLIYLIKPKQ